jgi:hypothetical protein
MSGGGSMKRWMAIFTALGLILAMGASFKPIFLPGVYDLKPEGTWDLVSFPKDVYHYDKFSTYSTSKPANLKLDFPTDRFAGFQYSRFTLGNAGNVFNFVIANQRNYFYDALYIDLDHNGVITAKEEVKIEEKQNVALGYVFQSFEADPKIIVDYRISGGKVIARPLDIKLTFVYQKNSQRAEAFYILKNNTLMTGTTLSEKDPLYFAIADGDNNGCYNDFGNDLVFFDRNGDRKFDYVKESQPLAELQDIKVNRKTNIYRLVLSPWPVKLGIISINQTYKLADFEPKP